MTKQILIEGPYNSLFKFQNESNIVSAMMMSVMAMVSVMAVMSVITAMSMMSVVSMMSVMSTMTVVTMVIGRRQS